jgi:flagellar hook-length control protein FliK
MTQVMIVDAAVATAGAANPPAATPEGNVLFAATLEEALAAMAAQGQLVDAAFSLPALPAATGDVTKDVKATVALQAVALQNLAAAKLPNALVAQIAAKLQAAFGLGAAQAPRADSSGLAEMIAQPSQTAAGVIADGPQGSTGPAAVTVPDAGDGEEKETTDLVQLVDCFLSALAASANIQTPAASGTVVKVAEAADVPAVGAPVAPVSGTERSVPSVPPVGLGESTPTQAPAAEAPEQAIAQRSGQAPVQVARLATEIAKVAGASPEGPAVIASPTDEAQVSPQPSEDGKAAVRQASKAADSIPAASVPTQQPLGDVRVVEAAVSGSPAQATSVETHKSVRVELQQSADTEVSNAGAPANAPGAAAPAAQASVSAVAAQAAAAAPAAQASAVRVKAASDTSDKPVDATQAVLGDSAAKQAGPEAARAQDVTGADQDRLIARIAGAIAQAESSGRSTVRMRLYPPELGTIKIEVSSVRGAVTVRIEASTPSTQGVLQSNLASLHSDLRQAGVDVRNVEVQFRDTSAAFGAEDRSGGRASHEPPRNTRHQPDDEPAEKVEAVVARGQLAQQGILNLFL